MIVGFNEYSKLNEGRMVTHVFDIMRQMKSIDGIEKSVELVNTSTGMIGLYRHRDGNAYEIEVRPAEYARNKEAFGKLLKKKGEYVKGTETRYKDVPKWWEEKDNEENED